MVIVKEKASTPKVYTLGRIIKVVTINLKILFKPMLKPFLVF